MVCCLGWLSMCRSGIPKYFQGAFKVSIIFMTLLQHLLSGTCVGEHVCGCVMNVPTGVEARGECHLSSLVTSPPYVFETGSLTECEAH